MLASTMGRLAVPAVPVSSAALRSPRRIPVCFDQKLTTGTMGVRTVSSAPASNA